MQTTCDGNQSELRLMKDESLPIRSLFHMFDNVSNYGSVNAIIILCNHSVN